MGPCGVTFVRILVGFVTLALIPAALHGFGRVYVGIHYPGDVLAGAALGVLGSYGILRLLPYLEPYPSRLLRLGKRVYLA